MSRVVFVAAVAASLVVFGTLSAAPASAADGNGCRMEKQCKWVNFQKICVWTKVCR